jgi:hypothetical protein
MDRDLVVSLFNSCSISSISYRQQYVYVGVVQNGYVYQEDDGGILTGY